MEIQVRYVGTTKTPVITYEVYTDGNRIGFVKMNASQMWQSVQWRHKHIGTFTDRAAATKAVIETYREYRKQCTKRQARTFEARAVKLKQLSKKGNSL
jgi:hypothetical protein